MNAFPLRWGTRLGCLVLPLPFNTEVEILATAPRKEKQKKIWIGKEITGLSSFVDSMSQTHKILRTS